MAIRLLGERTRAEDALQDTFLKAYRAIERLKPGSNLRAWLYRILVNTAYDQLDRRKTRTRAFETMREQAERDELERRKGAPPGADRELQQHVEEAIGSLPEKYRDALRLRSLQGLPYSGVAEVLGIPETTARSLVHRGKRLLVPKLQHLMGELES